MIGRKRDVSVREFDDMESLREFLKSIKILKLASVGSILRKCADDILKEAMPCIGEIDFAFELLDKDSIRKIADDFENGVTITIPRLRVPGKKIIGPHVINIHDIKDEEFKNIKLNEVRRLSKKRETGSDLYYDDKTHTYKMKDKDSQEDKGFKEAKTAKMGVDYKYSCVKIDLPQELSKDVLEWGKKNIPDEDLFTGDESQGREDDIHITIFYGIKERDPEETGKIIKNIEPFEVRLGLINAFKDKEDYDVLKIEIESGDLERLHYEIEKKVDNKNSYPTYNPHVTISYTKKGVVDKFIGDDSFKGKTFKVSKMIFSDGHNKDYVLPLKNNI